MTEYSVIEADSIAELVKAVGKAMELEGWTCQGGISVWIWDLHDPPYPPSFHYAQALVR
jgi:hypothetical protein